MCYYFHMKRDEIIKRLEQANGWLQLTDQQRADVATLLADEVTQTLIASNTISGAEAATLAGVHPNTIRNWAKLGYLSVERRPSGAPRYRPDEVKRVSDGYSGSDFMRGLGVDPAKQ